LFCSFALMRFFLRACGDGDIAPCITLCPRWIWVMFHIPTDLSLEGA
jgi:hypothetical protein